MLALANVAPRAARRALEVCHGLAVIVLDVLVSFFRVSGWLKFEIDEHFLF